MFVQIALVVALLYLAYRFVTPRRPKNFPPGPRDFPFVGGAYVIPKLDQTFSVAMSKLGQKYGPVVGINLGMKLSLVITGYEAVKEVLMMDEFQGRPHILANTIGTGGKQLGIMFAQGELWKEQRRFTLRHLRDFGFGKASMEGVIHEEVQQCLENLKKKISKSADSIIGLHDAFGPAVINVLFVILAGKRFKHDDPKFLVILDKLYALFRSGSPAGNAINDWPFLRFIPPFKTVWKESMELRNAVLDMLEDEINNHMATRDPTGHRDFLDLYLNEIENSKGKGGSSAFYFKDQLKSICGDLFSAGAESTSNTVAFGMLYMLLYPEVQEKLQKELDTVVGRNRLPSYNDRPNLPYTEAVLSELLRVATIAPTTVPHSTTQDCKLMGYDVPKDTFVLVMLSSVHNEKNYWGDPEVFRPERFIGPDGKLIKSEYLMTFGIGKRSCPGEVLARVTYFNFFTAMMQTFRLDLIPGQPKPTTIPVPGFTVAPKPFDAKVRLR